MKDIILTEKQLEKLVTKMKTIKEDEGKGSYMAKQQLYVIAKMAEKMWEKMEEEGDMPSGILYKLKLDYMNLVLKIIESKSLDKGEIDTLKQITFKVVR